MTYNVYALYSPSLNKIYVGQSNNLTKRLADHNKGYSKYTSITKDWILFYQEDFDNRSDAIKREKQLKTSRGRVYLRAELSKNIKDN